MRRVKRKRWPYWARALRNLLLAFALLVTVWDITGLSLPGRLEFRRLERQALAPPSEIIADIPTRDPSSPHILIGLTEKWAMVGIPHWRSRDLSDSDICPLADGPTLICFGHSVGVPDWAGQVKSHAAYAALRPPEGSARAVLSLHNNAGDFSAEGIREGEIFLFYIRPEPDEAGRVALHSYWFSPDQYTYNLSFLDATGNIIHQISG